MTPQRILGASIVAISLGLLTYVAIHREHGPAIPAEPPMMGTVAETATASKAATATERQRAAQPATQPNMPGAKIVLERKADPAREPQFAAFEQWLDRFQTATPAEKAALEEEGKKLAQARLSAFADLVPTNPKRAIELALPEAARDGLPESIRVLLERPINTRGDLAVLATLPFASKTTTVPAVFRTATIDGEEYQTFTFGKGLQFLTKTDVPLNGYVVPVSAATKPPQNALTQAKHLLALNERPVRVLSKAEVVRFEQSTTADVLCSVSGQSWSATHEETAAEVGGQILTFCGTAHLKLLEDSVAKGLTTTGGKDLPTAQSSYTEGRKRMFLMRPYWSDQAVAMTTNASVTHFINFSNYMWQMSYGKLVFAALGKGSDISVDILMPGSVNDYTAGLGSGTVYNAVRDVARTNYGYDLSQYDFLYYITTDRPAASYCGLGYVGGVGFHLANSCFDAAVSSHEFGHNLGLNHAHFWDTDLQSIIGTGQNVEYGDNNDPMGGGGNPNQYNSRYKNYLGWITNTDIATIPTSGSNRYRLYCFDQDFGVGLRGLKFTYSGSQNYWVNFRQRKTSKAALMNGVQLLWTGNDNEGSYVLDVRLKGDADNNAVVIGRTYSDATLNFHLTPIGKGHTYPESIDVVAVTGAQPGNLPPYAFLTANTLTPNVGQAVTFGASASDPNGDALAYYWEFGDGPESYSSDNQPSQTHTFTTAGEYAVRCVVSDMRGGTAQHTLIVRVGNPSGFRISGHVLDLTGKPISGALVRAGSKSVFVDADGSYTIPGLTAGNYTVSALEPVRNAIELVHPFFNNPVSLGPNAQNIDFVVGTSAPPVMLVAPGAVWKYFDQGGDPGAGWQTAGFNDATWLSGPSQLGYGDGDEATVISFGGNMANKYPAYYFRTTFNVANPATLTNFVLNVLRDDGAIVYLNGTEIFRNNMPGGAVTFSTLAAANAADDGDTWFSTNVAPALLLAGANVIAAEVHQDSITSSDVTFDLSLTAENASNTPRGAIVYVDSPADNAVFTTPTNLTISAMAASTPAGIVRVEIHDGPTLLDIITSPPYSTILSNAPEGLHVLRAVCTDAGGIRRTSAPVNITVSAPVPAALATTFLPTGSVWRYFSMNVAAPAGWQNPGFNDASWSSGAARLGFNSGNVNLATVINGGPSSARYPTVYFRTAFVVNDPASVTNLSVTLARDDGAIVYLNGVEVLRNNILNGAAVTYSLLASNATDDGAIYYTFNVPASGLVPGTNILAAEVHQSSATSSDLVFDAGLTGLLATNRSRGCWLVSPGDGSTISLPGSATLTAEVVAGGSLGVTDVVFYVDGVVIGHNTTSPFSTTWSNPPGGSHVLTAIARDSAGAQIASAPVNVTVSQPPSGDALVSFGDVWKYLDNGSDLGVTWRSGAYNDSQWMAGPGRLGYGGDGEATAVSYGTNVNSKYVTTYFRRKFFVPGGPGAFDGLLLRLVRDDGAVVYINGVEVYRDNLQPGPVSYNSLALSAIGGADETTPIDVVLGTTNLFAGTNTLAVEIHQDSVTSSDVGFNLALIGLHSTNDGFYITSPANNGHYNMPADVSLSSYAGFNVSRVEYFDGPTKVAESTVNPYSANWSNPGAGTHTITAVATVSGGGTVASDPVTIVVGPAPAPIAPVFRQMILFGSTWKYWDSDVAVSNDWREVHFDDSGWPSGAARLGWGLDGEATLLTEGRITHYFRRSFVFNGGNTLDSLTFNVVRDDGVVVYLNGNEVFRTNMPSGPVTATTLASSTINTPDETTPVTFTLPTSGSGFLYGSNTIAVELHQAAANSSDGGFDLFLYGEGTTEARVYVGSPANGSVLPIGAPLEITAHAQAGSGRSIAFVELAIDGSSAGQVATPPFRFTWPFATAGTHTLIARAVDDLGNSITSPPVQISARLSLVLISSNSVWKYLDNGSNQGTNWSQPNFNDATWNSGPARLGYGGDGEETTVGYGPNATAKYITTYFRRPFVVPPNTYLTNFTFRLTRDDGAVVWVNGREAYRSNMPGGAILNTTAASSAVGGADETTFFPTTVRMTNVFPGTNIIAVEVHQSGGNSSDLGFDLELDGDGYAVNSALPPVISATLIGGQLQISWPDSAAGFRLYSSPQLGPGAAWQLIADPATPTNGFNVLTIPTTNAALFYRLQNP